MRPMNLKKIFFYIRDFKLLIIEKSEFLGFIPLILEDVI